MSVVTSVYCILPICNTIARSVVSNRLDEGKPFGVHLE